jgi:hypothetical protein
MSRFQVTSDYAGPKAASAFKDSIFVESALILILFYLDDENTRGKIPILSAGADPEVAHPIQALCHASSGPSNAKAVSSSKSDDCLEIALLRLVDINKVDNKMFG